MSSTRAVIGFAILAAVQLCRPLQAGVVTSGMTPDDIEAYKTNTVDADYVRREAFIPMRDGVKLYTLILMRKGTSGAPILLTRTPYGADSAAQKGVSQHLTPNRIEEYRFDLPMADHVFRKGHRIMVQIQSSWFPIYDRNPQSFVKNIFDARPEDYRKATQQVFRDAADPSAVILPVMPEGAQRH